MEVRSLERRASGLLWGLLKTLLYSTKARGGGPGLQLAFLRGDGSCRCVSGAVSGNDCFHRCGERWSFPRLHGGRLLQVLEAVEGR